MELLTLRFVPTAPCPVAGHHCKELGPILLTPALKTFISSYIIPSQPSFLQAKQAQLPQPLLIREVLQSPKMIGLVKNQDIRTSYVHAMPATLSISHLTEKSQLQFCFPRTWRMNEADPLSPFSEQQSVHWGTEVECLYT